MGVVIGRRGALVALAALAGLATGCLPGPQPPATSTRADVRVQLFDYLSTYASAGPARQTVLFLFSDEKSWTYTYLGGREWSVTMPTEGGGQRLLDQAAEWRLNEATKAVRPANEGAEAILRGLQSVPPDTEPTPTS